MTRRELKRKEKANNEVHNECPKQTRKDFYKKLRYVTLSIIAISVGFYIIFGDKFFFFLIISLSFMWFMFYQWISDYDLFLFSRPLYFHTILTVVPVIGIWFFGFGINDAYDNITEKPKTTISSQSNKKYSLLRVFEKGLLLYDDVNSQIVFADNKGEIVYQSDIKYNIYKGVVKLDDSRN